VLWGAIALRTQTRGQKWINPITLFGFGVCCFYVIPSIYWFLRPWPYPFPAYQDGLGLVMLGSFILGAPFAFASLLLRGSPPPQPRRFKPTLNIYGWLLLLPLFAGIGWRLYLVSLGWQGRLGRDNPTLLGSEDLAYLVGNLPYYLPLCYFALFAFGNRKQRRWGIAFWILDGLVRLYVLHRYEILVFVFHSIVFGVMIGWKPTQKQWAMIGVFAVLLVAVLPAANLIASGVVDSSERSYLTPGEVTNVFGQTMTSLMNGRFETSYGFESGPFAILDNFMLRLFDARSASAVMINVPSTIPYFHGETFRQALYALIPRYIWADKPDLTDINRVTAIVMPLDEGLNPTGTVAELYMNEGFLGVFLGGIACVLLCLWAEKGLRKSETSLAPAFLCVYPFLAELFLAANDSMTQRLAEGGHCILIIVILNWYFRVAIRRPRQVAGRGVAA